VTKRVEPTDIIDTDPYDPEVVEQYEQAIAQQVGEAPNGAQHMIERRKRAYHNVFTAGERDKADLEIVLADLMWFCKVWIPTYDIRDGVHAEELSKRKEGRREVFQRIKHFSCLDGDALMMLYTDMTTK
jgi:hypothetical protein